MTCRLAPYVGGPLTSQEGKETSLLGEQSQKFRLTVTSSDTVGPPPEWGEGWDVYLPPLLPLRKIPNVGLRYN